MKEQSQFPIPKHIIDPSLPPLTAIGTTTSCAQHPHGSITHSGSITGSDGGTTSSTTSTNTNTNTTILATSSSTSSTSSSTSANDKFTIPNHGRLKVKEGERILCSDRKGFFDGFRPKSFVLSSCRITILQAAQVLATYITDQLEHEVKLDKQLDNHEITQIEYESSLLNFEEDEWNRRWHNLFHTNKIWAAIGKFHLLTLIIRCYEHAICVLFLKKDGSGGGTGGCGRGGLSLEGEITLDRLTKDTYMSAIRKSKRLKEYVSSSSSSSFKNELNEKYYHASDNTNSSSSSSSSSSNEVTSVFDLGSQMFYTCLYANAITFLSDLTVQQSILLYGYYKFYVTKQRERKLKKLRNGTSTCTTDEDGKQNFIIAHKKKKKNGNDDVNDKGLYDDLRLKEEYSEGEGEGESEEAVCGENDPIVTTNSSDSSNSTWIEDEKAILMLSFFRRSTYISFVKVFGLGVASFGGAIGSMIYPGWGTVFGTQMGDAAVGAILDDE